jgi:hypothetical protein
MSLLWLSVPLMLVVAMRGDTRDTQTYIDIFRETVDLPLLHPLDYYAATNVEWGFGLASWALSSIGLGPRTLFLLVSAATFACIERAARTLKMSPYSVMPYYLGTFFLTQQLMQIRQGLAVAFAFWMILRLVHSQTRPLIFGAATVPAMMVHSVSSAPMLAALLLRPSLPRPSMWRIAAWLVVLIGLCVLAARLASDLEVFELVDKLALYLQDEEYSSARNVLDAANVRAVLLLFVLFLACHKPELAQSRAYLILLGLYAMSVGVRLGFLDFQILSGRFSTSFGFAEIFLVPMAVKAYVKSRSARCIIGLTYLTVHAVGTLTAQAPYLIDDYFSPIHADYATR